VLSDFNPKHEPDMQRGELPVGACELRWTTNSSDKTGQRQEWPFYRNASSPTPPPPPSPPPPPTPPHDTLMGYTLATRHDGEHGVRYTEWVKFIGGTGAQARGRTGTHPWLGGRELDQHTVEGPDENRSAVDDPDLQPVVQELSRLLRSGWRAAVLRGEAIQSTD
jgi:hypothetical protein